MGLRDDVSMDELYVLVRDFQVNRTVGPPSQEQVQRRQAIGDFLDFWKVGDIVTRQDCQPALLFALGKTTEYNKTTEVKNSIIQKRNRTDDNHDLMVVRRTIISEMSNLWRAIAYPHRQKKQKKQKVVKVAEEAEEEEEEEGAGMPVAVGAPNTESSDLDLGTITSGMANLGTAEEKKEEDNTV